MRELSDHESSISDCMSFMDFKKKKINPIVFHWADHINKNIADALAQDPEYTTRYAVVAHDADPYGPPPYKMQQTKKGNIRIPRAQLLHHWRIMRRVIPDIELANLDQIVEPLTASSTTQTRKKGLDGSGAQI